MKEQINIRPFLDTHFTLLLLLLKFAQLDEREIRESERKTQEDASSFTSVSMIKGKIAVYSKR